MITKVNCPSEEEINSLKENKTDEIRTDELSEDIVNELVNVEYNSTDKNGNTFYLNAEKATVELEGAKNSNKVKGLRCNLWRIFVVHA